MTKDLKEVKPRKFATYLDPWPRKPEKNSGISITDPDPGLSLKEMVQRYVDGTFQAKFEPEYDDDENTMFPQNFDLSDLSQAKLALDAARDLEKRAKDALSAAKKKAKDEERNSDASDTQPDSDRRPKSSEKRGTSAKGDKARSESGKASEEDASD